MKQDIEAIKKYLKFSSMTTSIQNKSKVKIKAPSQC